MVITVAFPLECSRQVSHAVHTRFGGLRLHRTPQLTRRTPKRNRAGPVVMPHRHILQGTDSQHTDAPIPHAPWRLNWCPCVSRRLQAFSDTKARRAGHDTVAMKKSAKLVTGKAVKCQAPKVHKCRNKARYLQGHKADLPENVQKLLDESSCHKQGKIINDIVVKNSSGKWCFKLDSCYIQETVCGFCVRRSHI